MFFVSLSKKSVDISWFSFWGVEINIFLQMFNYTYIVLLQYIKKLLQVLLFELIYNKTNHFSVLFSYMWIWAVPAGSQRLLFTLGLFWFGDKTYNNTGSRHDIHKIDDQ